MKKTLIIILFLKFCSVYSQVQVKNTSNTAPLEPSSMLDVNYSDKGIIIPSYDLQSLTSITTPIANPVDGLIIFNKGGSTTSYPSGIYTWSNNSWNKVTISGNEAQSMVLNITRASPQSGSPTLIPANAYNNVINNFTVSTNSIIGASLSNGDTIVLPKGIYVIKYSVDTINNQSNTNTGDDNISYELSGNNKEITTCIRSFMINSSNSTPLSGTNRDCKTSNSFSVYNGTFFLDLSNATGNTNVQQRFEFDDTGNINVLKRNPLRIRTNYVLLITKMPN